MNLHEIEERDFGRGPALWDADPDVCCAAYQLGACAHTESDDTEYCSPATIARHVVDTAWSSWIGGEKYAGRPGQFAALAYPYVEIADTAIACGAIIAEYPQSNPRVNGRWTRTRPTPDDKRDHGLRRGRLRDLHRAGRERQRNRGRADVTS